MAQFGMERFGQRQAEKHQKALETAIGLIASFPLMGADKSDVKSGARRHVHGSHAIYYTLKDEEVLILRVFGPGQDPADAFDES